MCDFTQIVELERGECEAVRARHSERLVCCVARMLSLVFAPILALPFAYPQHVAIDTSMEMEEAEEDVVIDRKRTAKPLQSTRKEPTVR